MQPEYQLLLECDSCVTSFFSVTPFKEGSLAKQRFMVSNYGPLPSFSKKDMSWHHGARNYYFCVKMHCLRLVSPSVTCNDLDISLAQNNLLPSDIDGIKKNGFITAIC